MNAELSKDEPPVVPNPGSGKLLPPDDSTVVWQKLDLLGDRLAVISERTVSVEISLKSVDKRFDAIDKRLVGIESKLSQNTQEMASIKGGISVLMKVAWGFAVLVLGALAIWVWPHVHLLWQN
jgi:hypothetical protein